VPYFVICRRIARKICRKIPGAGLALCRNPSDTRARGGDPFIIPRMRRLRRTLLAIPAVVFCALAYAYLTLPDVRPLRRENPKTTAFMELRAREARARGEQPRHVHRWVPYGRISEHLKRAVLVAEDAAFWDHEGIDLEQMRRSMEINFQQGRVARGGSTITQQLAKNLYLSPSKNPLRNGSGSCASTQAAFRLVVRSRRGTKRL